MGNNVGPRDDYEQLERQVELLRHELETLRSEVAYRNAEAPRVPPTKPGDVTNFHDLREHIVRGTSVAIAELFDLVCVIAVCGSFFVITEVLEWLARMYWAKDIAKDPNLRSIINSSNQAIIIITVVLILSMSFSHIADAWNKMKRME